MAKGLRYETGREMPPGMQELAADKLVEQLRNAAQVADVPEFRCFCGNPTNNTDEVGSVILHICDDCKARIHREVAWQSRGETYRQNKVVCPFCGYEYDGYLGYQFEVGETEGAECELCGRKFDVDVTEVRYYSTKRSVCEMPEDWQPDEED